MRGIRRWPSQLLFFSSQSRIAVDAASRPRPLPGSPAVEAARPALHRGLAARVRPEGFLAPTSPTRLASRAPQTRICCRRGSAASAATSVLRMAQLSADERRDFLLFMVQRTDGEVFFFLSTRARGPQEGLRLDPEAQRGRRRSSATKRIALPARSALLGRQGAMR